MQQTQLYEFEIFFWGPLRDFYGNSLCIQAENDLNQLREILAEKKSDAARLVRISHWADEEQLFPLEQQKFDMAEGQIRIRISLLPPASGG